MWKDKMPDQFLTENWIFVGHSEVIRKEWKTNQYGEVVSVCFSTRTYEPSGIFYELNVKIENNEALR